jgi:hypothetical protein
MSRLPLPTAPAPRPVASRVTVTAVTRRLTAARAAADLPDPTGERSGLLRLAAAELAAGRDVDQVLADIYRAAFISGWIDGASDEALNAAAGHPATSAPAVTTAGRRAA